MPQTLPVEAILDELKQQLSTHHDVVLEAPPGAGKTTLVPLALLNEDWLTGKKILMLEPRRIAARSAAHRLAQLLNETPGQTVGYRMRLDTKVGRQTRLEIITEGILTRILQQDPALEDVGLVIFDEFHERSLDSDLALALCLRGRELFRDPDTEPLKILLMSATLDDQTLTELLSGAALVRSAGRAYPVEVIYGRAAQPRERISERMVSTIRQALSDNPQSNILAFLPGQGEIRWCADALTEWLVERKIRGIHLCPLYGNLSPAAQQQAIAPLSEAQLQAGEQKVVLATNIAETSLTIEGVDVVVDSGLMRESRFNPSTGMSGLHTVKISRASATQRAGRAGRLRPGKCYRLWSESQQAQLETHNTPEIMQADLAPLALQLLQWGEHDPQELCWSDPPPTASWQQALDLLRDLDALDNKHQTPALSRHGQAMARLPAHPRLAHLLLCGAAIGFEWLATRLAALLSERDPFSRDHPDISYRLAMLSGDKPCPAQQQGWLARTRQLTARYAEQLQKAKATISTASTVKTVTTSTISPLLSSEQASGYLLACAWPDRIARRRHSGSYQLSNGRSAAFQDRHVLGKSIWLAVAEVSRADKQREDIIRSAARLDSALFDNLLSDTVSLETVLDWDKQSGRFIAEEQEKVGALVLRRTVMDKVPVEEKRIALLDHIRKQGLDLLPWKQEQHQWRARVSLLREMDTAGDSTGDWPDVSEAGLLANLEHWLALYLDTVNTQQDFRKLDLQNILQSMLSREQQQRLQQLAPTRLKVPSGSAIAIDYTQHPPVLAVKLQEMFGLEQTPSVAGGKVVLIVHLLSPAGRPLQITQDLAGFWRSSYHEVRKDMKGRYPKHPWPENPLKAPATAKTKARLR